MFQDKSLLSIACTLFIAFFTFGLFATGCSAPMQNVQTAPAVLETTDADGRVTRVETLPDGQTAVSSLKPGSSRTTNHATPATAVNANSLNKGTCRYVVDGHIVDSMRQAKQLAFVLKVPETKIGTQCFRRDRLVGSYAANGFTVGQ